MALGQGLCEYKRSSPWPDRKSTLIGLKRHDMSLTLDIPNFGVSPAQPGTDDNRHHLKSLSRVALAHAAFRAYMQPDLAPDDAFYQECTAEVNIISLFFPDIKSDRIRICFTAWLAFACMMDDILETLPLLDRETALVESIDIVRGQTSIDDRAPVSPPHSPPHSPLLVATKVKDTRIQDLARALRDHCIRHLSRTSAHAFFQAVCVVLRAHVDEVRFLQGRIPNSLQNYMNIRSRTISLNPFFEVIKSEYLTAESNGPFSGAWEQLQLEVSRAAGLQNDLIGLERDLENGEQLNAVIVLMRALGSNKDMHETDEALLSRCIALVNAEHNQSVARCLEHAAQINQAADNAPPDSSIAMSRVARHFLLLCETHLKWCASAKRYQTKDGGQRQHSMGGDLSLLGHRGLDSYSLSEASPSSQIVHSNGIFRGLPAFPDLPEFCNLTALVTGATGVSGYNMVKVLAASHRWSKIYCLSSRPPPENFFSDLGDAANRVEHVMIDFLDDPAQIAHRLQEHVPHVLTREHRDHIFYFSYMQPAPKGNVLDLWANADELAAVNLSLFTNFISALQRTPLKPRRFMLQTGSKHYAFYLGPASLPAFESDPRVLLDKNFYYDQEDALMAYCQSVGAAWNVARPSYIVGAVRDGTLNHLIGFGIYAAVQAYLGQPICFPGDYSAWDREQVQSTGLLNAYFEEWLVLTDKTANEAFNIHDGQSFTWGRLWPYLAAWYKVEWCPPEEDTEKYRVVKLPFAKTPRGYGPQATLRSTFSLLEWSLQPHVEKAWKELAARHDLVLDPFDDRYRARIFSFADSAVIGDAPMTTSVRKARDYGFFGTVDSYQSIFDTMHDLAKLKLILPPVTKEFVA
ncbi:hypothetical protein MFIFM68171_05643 [Madurella fahalii]|uniref:PRISE-like Rossmann-fold domain-containing protein n=1 Tax=Madurella fahalii TaxID=1157608 RepID=A0ABQ0GCE5_9PEZI